MKLGDPVLDEMLRTYAEVNYGALQIEIVRAAVREFIERRLAESEGERARYAKVKQDRAFRTMKGLKP